MSAPTSVNHAGRRALEGVRVVVTRAQDQAGGLVDALAEHGAETVVVPVIKVVDPEDKGVCLRQHLKSLGTGDWLVITSPNGASKVAEALRVVPLADDVAVAVIGPGTKSCTEDLGIRVDLIPDASIAEGLLEAFPSPNQPDAKVLLARAAEARRVLPEGLRAKGWIVHDVAAYQTLRVPVEESNIRACRRSDIVAFTASSTVTNLHSAVGVANLPPAIAAIGPATAKTASELGLTVDVVAEPHTINGLVKAIVEFQTNASGRLC
ncbi:MAG: uroporphyrinogen-III synthase [Acidimicrobiia bacterium]|nr:uroporphyrinogen-III synthase [Acidimicrobiia bacterium]